MRGPGLLLLALFELSLMACQGTTPQEIDDPLGPSITGQVGGPGPVVSTRRVTLSGVLGPGSIDIVPGGAVSVGNCIPFGATLFGPFTGFIYRNVPAFALVPGDLVGFDLGSPNDVDNRRNIYLAPANKNPAACTISAGNVVSQGITAAGWTKVVSDTQTPATPRGNSVIGDYELRYVIESAFAFGGGGLIIGFDGGPGDGSCTQVLVTTSCLDPSGQFYSRFFLYPSQFTGVLDNLGFGGSGTAFSLGGVSFLPSGGGVVIKPPNCYDLLVVLKKRLKNATSVGVARFFVSALEGLRQGVRRGDPTAIFLARQMVEVISLFPSLGAGVIDAAEDFLNCLDDRFLD